MSLALNGNGTFALEYYNEDCSFKSACIEAVPTSFEKYTLPQGFEVSPNPATEVLHIKGLYFDHLEVYNLLGDVVLRSKSPDLHLKGLISGIYVIAITDASGHIYSKRLQVQ